MKNLEIPGWGSYLCVDRIYRFRRGLYKRRRGLHKRRRGLYKPRRGLENLSGQAGFSLQGYLLFLFDAKKKKVTKRKTAGFRFEAATNRFPAEAQELASLKQPALLFA